MQFNDEETENFADTYRNYESKQYLRPASFFSDSVLNIHEGLLRGDPFLFSDRLEFRMGELTIWAGASGHGKSLMTGQAGQHFIYKCGKKVCIMSLEMLPSRTLLRMGYQCLTKATDTEHIKAWLRWISPNLLLLDRVGHVSPETIYGAMICAVENYGCTHIFIDNLMKVVGGEFGDQAMNGQKDFINVLCSLSKDLGCHVHLVHHVRKADNEDTEIDKYSIRGSASITDQADNIILIQRNLAKEKARQENRLTMEDDIQNGDTLLKVAKQRNGEWQGVIPLWFDELTGAYCPTNARLPDQLCFDKCIPEEQRLHYTR